MEEGYLAKIIHGDGSKEIKVGEVMSLCYCTATQVHLCVCACVCACIRDLQNEKQSTLRKENTLWLWNLNNNLHQICSKLEGYVCRSSVLNVDYMFMILNR